MIGACLETRQHNFETASGWCDNGCGWRDDGIRTGRWTGNPFTGALNTLDVRQALAEAENAAETRTRPLTGTISDLETVVAFVNAHPEGVRSSDVEAECPITAGSARKCLQRAADAGRIMREGRGLYMPYGRVAVR